MPEAPPIETLLAFDVGLRRIGVAVGNSFARLAQPLEVIPAVPTVRAFARIRALIDEWQPQRFVVGLPRRADGTPTHGTAPARKFANRLHGRFGKPVEFVDESYTSVEAEATYGKIAPSDHHAAALILQQYFDDPPSGA